MKQILFIIATAFIINVVVSNPHLNCINECVTKTLCKDQGKNTPLCVNKCVQTCSVVSVTRPFVKPVEERLTYDTPSNVVPTCLETCNRYKKCQRDDLKCKESCKLFCETIRRTPTVASTLSLDEPTRPTQKEKHPLNKCIECLKVNNCLTFAKYKTQKCSETCSSVCPTRPPKTSQKPKEFPTVKPQCIECLKKNECFKIGKLGTKNCRVTCRDACSPATKPSVPVKTKPSVPVKTKPSVPVTTKPAVTVCVDCLRLNKCLAEDFGSKRCTELCPTCPTRKPVERVSSENKVLSVRIENCKTCLKENDCYKAAKIGTPECQSKCKEQCGFFPRRTPAPKEPTTTQTPAPTTTQAPVPTTSKNDDRAKCFTCFRGCLKVVSKFGECKEQCKNECQILKK